MSIDLIYAGRDTREVVKELSTEWLVSGPIRVALHLSNVWHLLGNKALIRDGAAYRRNGISIFGPNEPESEWTQWAAKSSANYEWLYFYGIDMCEEYARRLPHLKEHGICLMMKALDEIPDEVPEGDWGEPTFGKDVELKV